MMKMSTTMRTRAPAISAVRAVPIRLPVGRRGVLAADPVGVVGAGVVGAEAVAGAAVGVGTGAGATPLGEEGGRVAECGAGSVMALLPQKR
jgi:hypothetical protein